MRREFLQLAHVYNGESNIAAWYASTKFDGSRAWWDGGITRGLDTKEVPWANTEKEGRYITIPKATGLWSRYGRPIQAPDWWLDTMPDIPLDGELWMGRGKFQESMSVTRQLVPNNDWERVKYMVFDAPSYREVMQNGTIRIKGKYEKDFVNFLPWLLERAKTKNVFYLTAGKTYEFTIDLLRKEFDGSHPYIEVVQQTQLPFDVEKAKEMAYELAAKEIEEGGEGVMVRLGRSMWNPKRVHTLVKIKPYLDDEGLVVGYKWGKETELGSKLLGMMGSLMVQWHGKIFSLSGFTEAERQMSHVFMPEIQPIVEGSQNPGQLVSASFYNPKFPLRSTITFQYRELTVDGIPKEARYYRRRPEE